MHCVIGPNGTKSDALLSTLANLNNHYKCDICDFVTPYASCLKMHSKSHLSCEKCGETFSGEYAKRHLERHMKKHAKIENKTLYECTKCHKLFNYKSNYTNHVRFTKKCRPMNL